MIRYIVTDWDTAQTVDLQRTTVALVQPIIECGSDPRVYWAHPFTDEDLVGLPKKCLVLDAIPDDWTFPKGDTDIPQETWSR